ncbi:MAG: hypothetical protein Q8O01_02670 [Candidatus Omnitrophota bacterium]|nr:hypothetical protein [Candidatus Omnitrophota bacterium]
MRKYFVSLAVIFAVIASSAISASSQTNQIPAKEDRSPAQISKAAPAQTPQVAPAQEVVKAQELSIYGEVQTVNVQAASMAVQYYDYDNDEEKTLEVTLDKDSGLENVKTIGEIKKGDWVDVAYTVTGGKNIARNVSVETEEIGAEDNAPVDTTE